MNIEECPSCKGGKSTVTVVNGAGQGKNSSFVMDCPICNGTGKLSKRQVKSLKKEKEMWCKCERPDMHNAEYHEDTHRMKHHWTCGRCKKICQVG